MLDARRGEAASSAERDALAGRLRDQAENSARYFPIAQRKREAGCPTSPILVQSLESYEPEPGP